MTRTSDANLNPGLMSQRASMFAASVANLSVATLLVRRNATGLQGFLLATGTDEAVNQAALNLAYAVGAQAGPAEVPEDLAEFEDDESVIGWLEYEAGSTVAKETQQGIDPTETARLMANAIPLVAGWRSRCASR